MDMDDEWCMYEGHEGLYGTYSPKVSKSEILITAEKDMCR